MRQALAAMMLVVSFATVGIAQAKREHPCKTIKNASSCKVVHGRLRAYNGTPVFRLWHIGTNHLYGIYSGPGIDSRDDSDNEAPELPDNFELCGFGNEIYADFEICELDPFVKGSMQAACIESAKNLFVKWYDEIPQWCHISSAKAKNTVVHGNVSKRKKAQPKAAPLHN